MQGAGQPGHRQPGDHVAQRRAACRGRPAPARRPGRAAGRTVPRDRPLVSSIVTPETSTPSGPDLLAHPAGDLGEAQRGARAPGLRGRLPGQGLGERVVAVGQGEREHVGQRRRAHLPSSTAGAVRAARRAAGATPARSTSPPTRMPWRPRALRKAGAALIAGSAGVTRWRRAPGARSTGPSSRPPRSARPRCPPAPRRARSGARRRSRSSRCRRMALDTPRRFSAAAVWRGQVVQPGPPGDGAGAAAAGGQQGVPAGHEDDVVRTWRPGPPGWHQPLAGRAWPSTAVAVSSLVVDAGMPGRSGSRSSRCAPGRARRGPSPPRERPRPGRASARRQHRGQRAGPAGSGAAAPATGSGSGRCAPGAGRDGTARGARSRPWPATGRGRRGSGAGRRRVEGEDARARGRRRRARRSHRQRARGRARRRGRGASTPLAVDGRGYGTLAASLSHSLKGHPQ